MPKPAPKRSLPVVWIVVAGVVVLAAVLGILAASSGDDSNDSVASGPDSSDGTGGSATTLGSQTGEVQVDGDALERFPGADAVDPAIGETIPTISGQTFDGSAIEIGPGGGARVVVFLAHWCPHCQREVPLLVDHLRDNPMPDDVTLVTVATGTSPDRPNYPPQAWLGREGWKAPVLLDNGESTAALALGLSAYPYFLAIDADGKLVARGTGELTMEAFDALVDAARTGEPL